MGVEAPPTSRRDLWLLLDIPKTRLVAFIFWWNRILHSGEDGRIVRKNSCRPLAPPEGEEKELVEVKDEEDKKEEAEEEDEEEPYRTW